MGRPVSLLLPVLTGLPLLSRKPPPHSPYVIHTLSGLTIMLGLSTARGQHHFPISSVLFLVAGEMSDPQLVLSQPAESGNRVESSYLRQDKQKHKGSRNSAGVKHI